MKVDQTEYLVRTKTVFSWNVLSAPSPIPDVKVRLQWFNCASIVLNYAATIFNYATLTSRYGEDVEAWKTFSDETVFIRTKFYVWSI